MELPVICLDVRTYVLHNFVGREVTYIVDRLDGRRSKLSSAGGEFVPVPVALPTLTTLHVWMDRPSDK